MFIYHSSVPRGPSRKEETRGDWAEKQFREKNTIPALVEQVVIFHPRVDWKLNHKLNVDITKFILLCAPFLTIAK